MLTSLLACMALFAADDPTKADLAKFQGTWIFRQDEGTPREMKFVFEKDRVRVIFVCCKNGEKKGTIKLDATSTPGLIDLDVEGKAFEGIYRLDGDTLELYFAEEGVKERPTEFPKEKKKNHLKLSRVKD
ncbi:hypothetical protein AYO40_01865 [Planctomycetaceae bacterium SCGC AG-212-D15]|nr:hypothetical protein AYO40_01865 [Planctomycetaceae bacterium SCGC AG-212-D15]